MTLQRVEEDSEPDDELDATFMSVCEEIADKDEDGGRLKGGGKRAPTPTERELQMMQQEREEQRRRSKEQASARDERARRRSAGKDAL